MAPQMAGLFAGWDLSYINDIRKLRAAIVAVQANDYSAPVFQNLAYHQTQRIQTVVQTMGQSPLINTIVRQFLEDSNTSSEGHLLAAGDILREYAIPAADLPGTPEYQEAFQAWNTQTPVPMPAAHPTRQRFASLMARGNSGGQRRVQGQSLRPVPAAASIVIADNPRRPVAMPSFSPNRQSIAPLMAQANLGGQRRLPPSQPLRSEPTAAPTAPADNAPQRRFVSVVNRGLPSRNPTASTTPALPPRPSGSLINVDEEPASQEVVEFQRDFNKRRKVEKSKSKPKPKSATSSGLQDLRTKNDAAIVADLQAQVDEAGAAQVQDEEDESEDDEEDVEHTQTDTMEGDLSASTTVLASTTPGTLPKMKIDVEAERAKNAKKPNRQKDQASSKKPKKDRGDIALPDGVNFGNAQVGEEDWSFIYLHFKTVKSKKDPNDPTKLIATETPGNPVFNQYKWKVDWNNPKDIKSLNGWRRQITSRNFPPLRKTRGAWIVAEKNALLDLADEQLRRRKRGNLKWGALANAFNKAMKGTIQRKGEELMAKGSRNSKVLEEDRQAPWRTKAAIQGFLRNKEDFEPLKTKYTTKHDIEKVLKGEEIISSGDEESEDEEEIPDPHPEPSGTIPDRKRYPRTLKPGTKPSQKKKTAAGGKRKAEEMSTENRSQADAQTLSGETPVEGDGSESESESESSDPDDSGEDAGLEDNREAEVEVKSEGEEEEDNDFKERELEMGD